MINSFVLKIIACISMIFDHSGYIILGKISLFNYIGRLAFPIFAFQISEGYAHTSNIKKYLTRLGTFALISQIPFILFKYIISNSFVGLNIFFTLFIGLISIIAYNKISNKFLSISIAVFLALFAELIHTDYGMYGVSIIFFFYVFRNNKVLMSIFFIFATIIFYAVKIYNNGYFIIYSLLCFCTCIPIIFIILYNGKKGKSTKLLLYFFYPIHLLILCGIYLLTA